MQGSNTFIFEELDQQSKDYLLAIGKNKGIGFPGVYVGKSNSWWCFLVAGFVFLGFIPVVNFADTFAEPKAQAMLQTALFLVGGWFVILSFRRKGFFSSASNLCSFIFVDGKYYWNWNHYSVDVVNIENIKSFVYLFNEQFKTYDFKVDCSYRVINISVLNEELANKLYSLFFYKTKQEKNFDDSGDGFLLDETFKNLLIDGIPDPFKVRNEKVRILNYGFSILFLGFVFFLFFKIDIVLRDDQIWESIQSIKTDEKVYWLRIYLRDPRNIRHRNEAFTELGDKYKQIFQRVLKSKTIVDKDDKGNIDFISKQIPAIDPRNPNLLIPMAKLISVPDPKLIEGLQSVIFTKMLDLQEPFLKLSVIPSDPESVEVSKFIGAITDAYIHSIVREFGSEYFIVSSSLDGPGHINIIYSFIEEKNQQKIRFDVSYRQTLESEPTEKIFLEVNVPSRELKYVERAAKRLGVFTVGDQSGEWAFPN